MNAPATIKYRGRLYKRAALAPDAKKVRTQLTKQIQLLTTAPEKFDPAAILALDQAIDEVLSHESLDEAPHYAVAKAWGQAELGRSMKSLLDARQRLVREQADSIPRVIGGLKNILAAFPEK